MENGIPSYSKLIETTFIALKELGGSGKNDEINNKATEILNLPDEVVESPHKDKNMTELNYRLAWSRTLLKNYRAIENSQRAVWSITPEFVDRETVDGKYIEKNCRKPLNNTLEDENIDDEDIENSGIELPEEIKPWRIRLLDVLLKMNPYSFEKLIQRLLREMGFEDVKVTKKSGDGGIDGTGKFKINGIFSFNIAFQCKRYKDPVGAPEIRDFRGSLTTDIEKAVFITTSTFSKAAMEEADTKGKQKIDLMTGEELISKLAEFEVGVKEVRDYEINEDFFFNI